MWWVLRCPNWFGLRSCAQGPEETRSRLGHFRIEVVSLCIDDDTFASLLELAYTPKR